MTDQIELSHFRCEVRHLPHEGVSYLAREERKDIAGQWVRMYTGLDLDYVPIGRARDLAEKLKEKAQRELNLEGVRAAIAEKEAPEIEIDTEATYEHAAKLMGRTPEQAHSIRHLEQAGMV